MSNQGSDGGVSANTALNLPDLPPSTDMNMNPLQVSGATLSPYQMATGISHANAPFSPPPLHLDTLLDPVDMDTHRIPTSDRVSSPVVMDNDAFSFDQFVECEPSTRSRREHVEKFPNPSSAKRSLAPLNDFPSENSFPVFSDAGYSLSARPRLEILNSRCPSEHFARVTSSKAGLSTFNGDPRYDQRLSQELSSDNTGSSNRSSTLDSNGGLRQIIYSTHPKQFADTRTRATGGNSTGFAFNDAAELTSGGTRSSNGSSRDGSTDSGAASPKMNLIWRHLIHTCCEVGHLALVEELIEAGIDINKQDSVGNTPLHITASSGQEEVMAYLLEKGCNVNARNHAGWTAIHLASVKGHRACLGILLGQNASPWARLTVSE